MMLESQSSALTVSPIPPQNADVYLACFEFFVKTAQQCRFKLALALISFLC